ncbi:hypothetical protein CI109_101293 [Kwoniella shandongensis]|uniref:Uncharacterized protein n=1 Tax=Kwoniella shandongensis TaxID=1734106 RepID=A0A5M6BU51_9TREE|nr:uncharacterized protein CI109_005331 [Kwoniella shandongensis]KAA5526374.1 hypothetical protein CI109_005331 [Kwoniella shandongensis]
MPHKRAKRSIRDAETAKKGHNLAPQASTYDDTPRSASRIFNAHAVQSAFRKAGRITSEDTGERKPKPSSSTNTSSSSSSSKLKPQNGSSSSTTPTTKQTDPKKPAIPSILPNESLGEYNRRVEEFLRPGVSKAIKEAASIKAAEEAAFRREKKDRKKRTRIERLVKLGKMPQAALDELDKEMKNKAGKRKRGDEDEGSGSDDNDDDGDKTTTKPREREEKSFKPIEAPRRLNDIVQAPPSLPHLRKLGQEKKVGKGVYGAVGKGSGKDPLNAGQRRILEEERERVVKMYRDMKAAREEAKVEEKGAKVKVKV